jgi:hypothetical protein
MYVLPMSKPRAANSVKAGRPPTSTLSALKIASERKLSFSWTRVPPMTTAKGLHVPDFKETAALKSGQSDRDAYTIVDSDRRELALVKFLLSHIIPGIL